MSLNIVILAAGQGKRMHSSLPKVLHPLAGKPLLAHVLDTCQQLQPAHLIVVYGHGGEAVPGAFPATNIQWALQETQLGTGHAVMQALPLLNPGLPTLVLYGDVPLVQATTLRQLLHAAGDDLGLLTVRLDNPTGYGRIVRDGQGTVLAVIEEKDADPATRSIQEVNTGLMVLPAGRLGSWLGALSSDNAQGEYYLTDVVAQAVADDVTVACVHPAAEWEVMGVNSKRQLAELERSWQRYQALRLLDQGVLLNDPDRLDIRGTLECGTDVSIDVGCVFAGSVILEDAVEIGPYCVIRNATIRAGARVAAFTHIDSAVVGPDAVVGPYARLRPGSRLGTGAHVGNFVEVKNTSLGDYSKANHLAYLGDAQIGARVNIGAGTITCNYDGANKHLTIIEDDVFIGSDSQLVAPVRVGKGATLGAGTTLTKDAPSGALTVSRPKQVSIPSWSRPTKIKKESE